VIPVAASAAEAGLDGGAAGEVLTVARNVSTRILAISADMAVGLLVLPFNVAHLGTAAYGLWMLTASITSYFSVLDLGYGGALVKFVAQYRARRDPQALNEILSTTFHLFAGFGAIAYAVAIVLAIYLDRFFHLSPAEAHVGRVVLLIISLNVAAGMAFGVFGGVINGFQRYDLNSTVSIVTALATAVVNVFVLDMGYGLVVLVAATTTVRLGAFWAYRANAYRVFPALRIRPSLFRRERLRELTSFSVYMFIIDWARKLNYSLDAVVIAAFMNTSAVAVWSIGQRIVEATLRLTIQLSDVLFPTVVDNDVSQRANRLRAILLIGTRLSLATVIPIAVALILLAQDLVDAWVGPSFSGSVAVLQLLSVTVVFRVGNATATTLLKGAGEHRLVAVTNIVTGLVNLVLSVALVKSFGLVGVALGTLIPVCGAALFIMFPAACRRVELPLRRAFAVAIWPAAWPALVMTGYVVVTRPLLGVSMLAVAAQLLAAVTVYAITFLSFAISATERQLYLSKAFQLIGSWRTVATVPEGA
jgi:O-antigen/teichoic acid export membrane protein